MISAQTCHQELVNCEIDGCKGVFYHTGWQDTKRFCKECIDRKKKKRCADYHKKNYLKKKLEKKLEWIPPKLRKRLQDIEAEL